MLPSQLFLLPAFKCNLECVYSYLFISMQKLCTFMLAFGSQCHSHIFTTKITIIPPCMGRDLCLFVFLNSSQFLVQSRCLEPERQSCKTPDRLELLQSKASNEPLEEQRQASRLRVCLGEGSTCGTLITACLSVHFIPACPQVHLAACEGWRKRLKRFQFN